MLVSFWNNEGNRSGVTTNAASIALFFALRYKVRVALFENHLPSEIGLHDILLGKREGNSVFEEPIYYGKTYQINDIYRQIKSGFPIGNMSDSAIKLAHGRLHYYPQDDYGSHDLLDYELNKIIDRFIENLEKRYEVIFVDLKQFNTMTTKKIIEKSDVVFLNLLSDDNNEHDFFDKFTGERDKFYFVFCKMSRYEESIKIKLIEDYSINPNHVSFLPYNENFKKICWNGNLEGFLQKYKWATLGQKAFPLIYEFRRMTNYIKYVLECKRKIENDEISKEREEQSFAQ